MWKTKKIDPISSLANDNKNNGIKYTINIDTSNIINANNNNNNIEKHKYNEVYENNKIEDKTFINYHHEKSEKNLKKRAKKQ